LQLLVGLADHVPVVTAAPPTPPSPWLFGPRSDLLFGCGLLYTLLFGAFMVAGPELRALQPLWVAAAIPLLLGTPHYGATLLRVYERRSDRSSYVIFSLWATLAVIASFVAGLWVPAVGTFLITLYLTWSPWHYTGQNYGLAVMFLRRGGVALDPRLKRWLYLSFLLSFVLVFIEMHTAAQVASDVPAGYASLGGVRFSALGIPVDVAKGAGLVVFAAYALTLGRCVIAFRRAPARVLLPVALLALSQVLWFSLPFALKLFGVAPRLDVLSFEFRTHYFLWIAGAHSLQYLWVTAYYARQAGNWRGQLPNYLRVFAAGAAAWTLPALVFSPLAFGPLAFDHGLALLIAAAVNLHHFILDGAIWKLRGRIAEVLIRSGSAASEAVPRRTVLQPLVWATCAALLLVNVVGVVGDQLFVQSVESQRYAEAKRIAEWLPWLGRDRAAWRLEFGERLLRDRHFGEARQQLRVSEALAPSARAHVLIGMSYEAQQDWARAVEAYEAALAQDPDDAQLQALVERAREQSRS
jgi:hypothetical protein